MGIEWQSRDFLTDWTGLFNRHQSIDVPASYARTARNVDFFGSSIGKRMGSQLVNGWGTLATGTWSLVGSLLSGTVVDAGGFVINDLVMVIDPDLGVQDQGWIQSISGNAITITLSGGFGVAVPIGGVTGIVARRDLGQEINGLYHAVFRSGREMLLCASGLQIFDMWGVPIGGGKSFFPVPITTQFPTTSVSSTWSTNQQGPLTTTQTLVATDHSTSTTSANSSAASPDIIQIERHSDGTIIYEGTIASFPGGQVKLTNPALAIPQAGDVVTFFPRRAPGFDTRFTMFNDRVYVATAAGANVVQSGGPTSVQRQPPVVIEEPAGGGTPYIRRMGVRAPTNAPLTGLVASGALTGAYNYRYTYVNTLNGQESEGSFQTATITAAGSNIKVAVTQSPDPQVGGINIYRTLANQDGSWYLVNTAGPLPNVTTTLAGTGPAAPYLDATADGDLGTLMKTFSNETPPDTITMFAVWTQAGALIAIDNGSIAEGGEEVAWSDAPDIVNGVYKLESWPINNTLFVNRDDGDKLRSLGVFYDSVVVWKGRSMHRIVGAPPDIILQPISFRDDQSGVGIWSAKGFIMDTDVAIFMSDDGFYQVSRYEGVQQGFTSSRISRPIDDEWIGRTGVGSSMLDESHQAAHMVYHRLRRRLEAFACVDGNLKPNEHFVYQMEGTVDGTPHGWSEWAVPIDYQLASPGVPNIAKNYVTASCLVHFLNGQEAPYYGCGIKGLVIQGDVGAGEWQCLPVTFQYETVWFSAAGAGVQTRGRSCDYVIFPVAGMPQPVLLVGQDFMQRDAYQLPTLASLNASANLNALFLSLAQYHSLGTWERSATGLFRIQDFTFWFQAQPVGVVPRIVVPATINPAT